jgi:hypothetical protein
MYFLYLPTQEVGVILGLAGEDLSVEIAGVTTALPVETFFAQATLMDEADISRLFTYLDEELGGMADPGEASPDILEPELDTQFDTWMKAGFMRETRAPDVDEITDYLRWDGPPAEQMEQPAVYDNPGSAKVIPEGHDFMNKQAGQSIWVYHFRADYWEIDAPYNSPLSTAWRAAIKANPNKYSVDSPMLRWERREPQYWRANDAGVRLAIDIAKKMGYTVNLDDSAQGAIKVATRITEIEAACSADLRRKAKGLKVSLKSFNPKKAIWNFMVQGSRQYRVRVRADGNSPHIRRANIFLCCSCPYWQYQGPEHYAFTEGYLYGVPRGTASEPVEKDPDGRHGACKHSLAVLRALREYQMDPRGKTASLRFLADRVAVGRVRLDPKNAMVHRVSRRYISRIG